MKRAILFLLGMFALTIGLNVEAKPPIPEPDQMLVVDMQKDHSGVVFSVDVNDRQIQSGDLICGNCLLSRQNNFGTQFNNIREKETSLKPDLSQDFVLNRRDWPYDHGICC